MHTPVFLRKKQSVLKIQCWEDLLSEKALRKKGIEIELEAFVEKVIG